MAVWAAGGYGVFDYFADVYLRWKMELFYSEKNSTAEILKKYRR